mmetsp:Transcript_22061/g.32594  ORF Transcript_22061/g.32594 Transcript_22061/m.32594 type:complete len:200 (+) Transcript_22061:107-706(+)|eukprot:CAMPEP_0194199542 /NCGR_PEP_ID=MMETSP0156-20130528/528_1 /TAXON_ID=33649 /ORGANISM="Thalassionema nitzschioides, Strain L26-B" /LENGTH=199 /DNA_ID=CAMNT_0038924455 /DNA_START=68 /DNA_END=667 /DNA_ORIENTATION=+
MCNIIFLLLAKLAICLAWSSISNQQWKGEFIAKSRSQFLQTITAAGISSAFISSLPASAETAEKKKNLSNDELRKIVEHDLIDNSFLSTGKLSREIYDESATFTDEIDTYTLDKWIVGTQRLFVGDKSRVTLVGDIQVTSDQVELRFDEDLMFNIPFKPVVSLTGKLILKRDPSTGLITSYQEFWDQDVATVLKSAKFG